MARFSAPGTSLIYDVGAAFRDRCLLSDKSLLFDDANLWTAANLATLHQAFVGVVDESDRSFIEKFRDQVQPHGQQITGLAAEAMAVHFLFPSSVTGRHKRDLVAQVLSWGNEKLPDGHLVTRALDRGIGSGGQGFNARRRFNLYYLIELGIAWKKLEPEDARSIAADPWRFMECADAVEGADSVQVRHMLLHILFPDHFERIASGNHKQRIDEAFRGLLQDAPDDLDRRLYAIRSELTTLLSRSDLDFYEPPLHDAWYDESWYDESDDAGGMVPLDAIRHKRQIILYGPPGTGKTHRAKAMAEQIIRASALQLWGAARYFTEGTKVSEAVGTNIHRLQLHPAYSYEDFIRGLHIGDGGRTEYRPGYLLRLVAEIEKDAPDTRLPHVLILDEVNRTDLSRLLGECFSLLEDREQPVEIPGRDSVDKPTTLRLPRDLYVIGTMNLIDQSLEQIDFALRRRFLWLECLFNGEDLLRVLEAKWAADPAPYNGWEQVSGDFRRLVAAATALNEVIRRSPVLGPPYEIGHTYFFDVVSFLRREFAYAKRARNTFLWDGDGHPRKSLHSLWVLSLKPLLREYLSGLDANARDRELEKLESSFLTAPNVFA